MSIKKRVTELEETVEQLKAELIILNKGRYFIRYDEQYEEFKIMERDVINTGLWERTYHNNDRGFYFKSHEEAKKKLEELNDAK